VKEANALRSKRKLKRKELEEAKKGNISYRKKLKLMNN
jgi:stalled ribosome alternative rescue factor ArfA